MTKNTLISFVTLRAYSKEGKGGSGNANKEDDDWTPFQMNSLKDDFKVFS